MMDRMKVVYVISKVDSSLPLLWFFREMKKSDVDFHVVFLHSRHPVLKEQLESLGVGCHFVKYDSKADIPRAFLRLCRIINRIGPSLVHTHLFEASLLGLTAAKLLGVDRTVHTRHHASYHHVYFPGAVKYDKYINFISNRIIAISDRISELLVGMEGANPSKVRVIHHGFDLNLYSHVDAGRIAAFRLRNNIPSGKTDVGVVSRYTEWKGVHYIIPAFRRLNIDNPGLHLVLANAHGDFSSDIKMLLSELPKDSFTEIVFDADTPALFASFDVFVHCPIDDHSEAFGQVYVEALATGVPSVFTQSGVSPAFIKDGWNALVAEYKSSASVENSIRRILESGELASFIAGNGKSDVEALFGIELMVRKTLDCYADS